MSLGPRSLRGRVTLTLVAIAGVVLTLAAVVIVVVQRDQLTQSIDDSLDREVADVIASLQADPDLVLGQRGSDRFTQVLDGSSAVRAATPNLSGVPALIDIGGLSPGEPDRYSTSSAIPIEDDRYRILARAAMVGGEQIVVVVGENVDDLRDNLVALVVTVAVVVPLVTAVLGFVAWKMVGRTLAPVASIQGEVGRITLNRLGDRVPVPDTGDEIAGLATTMNEMLDRLDEANERQQHFVADASHELRSPLTRLRTSLEVDLADDSRDLNETGAELLSDVEDLQNLVDDLLFLARADRAPQLSPARVDLDAVVDRVVERLGETTAVQVDTTKVGAVEVTGNEDHLFRLVANVVGNAVHYARTRVWIATQVAAETGQVLLTVEDDGPGIEESDRDRIFERFTRLDAARSGSTGGAGLGLAIAREIAETHGGSIEVGSASTGGARFVITLPAWQT